MLVTLALRHESGGVARAVAATDGYAFAFRIGAILMLGAAVLVAVGLRTGSGSAVSVVPDHA